MNGMSTLGVLGVSFIVLKLTGFITWSWLWVLAPFWIGAAVLIGATVLVLICAMLVSAGEYLYNMYKLNSNNRGKK